MGIEEAEGEVLNSAETPRVYKGNLFYYSEPGVARSGFTLDIGDQSEPASFENLRYLKNGDRLKIISPDNPNESAWEGTVSFVPLDPSVEQEPGISKNLTQEGVAPDQWNSFFREGLSAVLIPAAEVKADPTS
ncbi:hypothetical protein M1349_04635 [Patescibacteria group bacterium]|nr:hypothetical protein [Patescibacteria group bacterium]